MPALAVDLMGVGLPQEQAVRVGYSALTTIAGTGTTQGTAKLIPAGTNNVLGTTAGGQDAFLLPSDAELEIPYMVINSTATIAQVFPPVGGTINQVAVNLPVTIAVSGHARVFIRKSATRWISFATA